MPSAEVSQADHKRSDRVRYWIGSMAITLVVSGTGFASWVSACRARERAENLLAAVQALDTAKVTEPEVESIVQRYGGTAGATISDWSCPSAHETHSVLVRSSFSMWVGHKLPMLQFMGNRAWGVQASFLFDDKGLCYFDYSVIAAMPDGFDLIQATSTYRRLPGIFNYDVHPAPPRYPSGLMAVATSGATAEQKGNALDFDLSCLTSFGGCKAGCELMPMAWLDYQDEARKAHFTLPAEDVNDPRCGLVGNSP